MGGPPLVRRTLGPSGHRAPGAPAHSGLEWGRVEANRSAGLVIIPAYNEAAVIGRVISELRQVRPDLDIVVVDDGSSDATVAVAGETGVPVIRLPYNLGVGGAMRAGFKYAASRGYNYAIQLDGDGQHDPRSIANLEDALSRADVVVGSRFVNRGSYAVRGPRRWMMYLLRVVVSRICGTRISDTTSGFRGSSKAAIELFARFYPTEYLGDTVESLILAHRTGLAVTEAPADMRPRMEGRSSASVARASAYLLRALLVIAVSLTRPPPQRA